MPDPLIRNIRTIGRYARHNEAEDSRFGAFLKGTEETDAELDAIVQEITDTVWAQIDCTTCGNCCKTLQIVVDDKDIRRLAKRLNSTVKQFEQKYIAIAAEDGAKYFNAMPCPFLDAENLCTVYEDRPQSCREYPFLYTPGFRQRTLAMIENNATCPIVFNVWQTLKGRVWRKRKNRGR